MKDLPGGISNDTFGVAYDAMWTKWRKLSE